MSRHPSYPATPEALLDAAGRAAGRVLAAREPRTGASRLGYLEIVAMAALIGEIGLAIAPEEPLALCEQSAVGPALPSEARRPGFKPALKTPETDERGAL